MIPVLNKFPELTTENLTLRKLNVEDRFEIFELRSNPIVNKYLDRPLATDISEAKEFIRKINQSVDQHQCFYWAISPAGESGLVGTIGLWNFSETSGSAEIGFELNPLYQSKGIMKETLATVIQFCFETLSLEKIEAVTHKDNLASIGILKKNDFFLSDDQSGVSAEEIKYLRNP